MIQRVDTMDDFFRIRDEQEPAYITSAKHGRIEVPCVNTVLVAKGLIVANSYNPNFVPKAKMELLQRSVLSNGFCFPIVVIWDDDSDRFVIIDGFHRYSMGDSSWLDLDYIPVVVLPHGMKKRLTATMQFNKARGVHQVDLDAELIRRLIDQGMDDEEIAVSLGIDIDTVYRYKQLTGIAEIFKNTEYSTSWEMTDDEK